MECKPVRLSHSAASRYGTCPRSYKYHYVDKLRADVQSSALLFGTAIDKATEHYALTKNFTETNDMFKNTWGTQNINGKDEDLRFLLNFTYSDKDLDTDLLKDEDWQSMCDNVSTEDPTESLKEAIYEKSTMGYANMSDENKLVFNYANWLCLQRKGLLMLKEFKRVFDDNVTEVLGTQVKVDLENENGDSVIGFIDLIVRWKGFDKPIVLDIKTAGREYEDDAVAKSPQLSLYVYAVSAKYEDTRQCGFLVLNKNINKNKHKKCKECGHDGTGGRHKTCDNNIDGKRCGGEWKETIYPKAKSQILISSVSEVLVTTVVENFDDVNKGIKAEVFPRNFESCIRFGSIKCSFYNICHVNNMDGLTKKVDE